MSGEDRILQELLERYPALSVCEASIRGAVELLTASYHAGGKLLCCGNGGSAADSEHLVGELMKQFRLKRPLPASLRRALAERGDYGRRLADTLEGALPAVSLLSHPALSSAFANDTDAELVYAQQVAGLGRPGDCLVAFSTSGRSRSCVAAVMTAACMGIKTIGITGGTGGDLRELCDIAIVVPESETFRIQELHLPVYHAMAAMLEEHFWGNARPKAE